MRVCSICKFRRGEIRCRRCGRLVCRDCYTSHGLCVSCREELVRVGEVAIRS